MSVGSGIALRFLPYLAVRGDECHYIESATWMVSLFTPHHTTAVGLGAALAKLRH